MKITNLSAVFTALTFLTTPGFVSGLPTESPQDPNVATKATDHELSPELATAPGITGIVRLSFTCPGDAPTTMPFEFGVGLVDGRIGFSRGRNVFFLGKYQGDSTPRGYDATIAWSTTTCVSRGSLVCRYSYSGWASARFDNPTSQIFMQQFAGDPPGFNRPVVTKVCGNPAGQPAGWCPSPNAPAQNCPIWGIGVWPPMKPS